MKVLSSPSKDREQDPLVNLSEITEVELIILKRMKEFTIGEHRSMFHGTGFDFVGLREWAPGDRFSSIDWPQSSLTNFSPLIVREFEQPSTANVVVVADGSLSTRCGVDGQLIAAAIARSIATIGMSAVFFQDMFGLMLFEADFAQLSAIRPRIGKNQVIHCLEAYEARAGLQDVKQNESISRSIAGFMRKISLIPVISDFLFERPEDILRELAHLNSSHDVFLILIDAAFAFEMPKVSAGWVEAFDVETGRSRVMSRGALTHMAQRVREWQDNIERTAKNAGLDVLRLGLDQVKGVVAILEFVMERRLRKVQH
jgi:uncharacterized protein (DUF58 family)